MTSMSEKENIWSQIGGLLHPCRELLGVLPVERESIYRRVVTGSGFRQGEHGGSTTRLRRWSFAKAFHSLDLHRVSQCCDRFTHQIGKKPWRQQGVVPSFWRGRGYGRVHGMEPCRGGVERGVTCSNCRIGHRIHNAALRHDQALLPRPRQSSRGFQFGFLLSSQVMLISDLD